MEEKKIVITESGIIIPYKKPETREQILINAVARYVNSTEFANTDVILAILDIEKRG